MIWSIAWKNIWRNKLRSLIVIAAVFLGVTGGIFSSAVMNGAAQQRIRDYIDLESAHIRIDNPKFDENNEVGFFIPQADSICQIIAQNENAEAVTARINIQAMAATASANGGVKVLAIDPETEKQVFKMQETICDTCGDFFATNKANRVVIGDKLAKKLNLKLKSKIVLTFQDLEGNLISAAFKVSGIFHTSNNAVNEYRIFVRRSDFQPLIMMPEGAASEIYVRLKDSDKIDENAAVFKKLFPQLNIQTWRETDPSVGYVDQMMNAFMYLFMFIILLAIGFGIVNTMLMIVLERTRELGMLASIGVTRRRLFAMITLETTLLSLIGGVSGMIVSKIVIVWTGNTGLDLSSIGQGLEAAGYSSFIYPSVSWSFFFGVSILIVLTGIIASLYPARKATKLNPADAVRID
ncbi:MAG: ABC transporter permease [Bacteroidetes bacterium HGW-Bacteroidetes-6]|jgi:ABC-type lipoprotein release transport system permease subunit|nr:MAG: ABC transporter permease [Bacteroidetes bacterium HGW-Bacteroidetes-6]